MRTLCLNLDLQDAEVLREALQRQLAAEQAAPYRLDERVMSLRATLRELNRMIERPAPRRHDIRGHERAPHLQRVR
ncbi:MAG TPA: hypothetical protein VGT61_04795 [Thermomicrobiales bacterium]|jgi:hypothetical protein|nr:hypothetical protein [Thermomicrobiales bacterium]